MKYANPLILIAALIAGMPQSALAQEQSNLHPYLTSKFFVDTGMFFPDRSIDIRVDGSATGPGDGIDFQKDLGLRKSDETFSLNFGWRFGEKWQLGGQYFESSGSTGKVLSEDVQWGDVVFGAGTGIVAGQDFTLVRMFFARRLESRNELHEFGFGGGLHWMEIGAFIEGTIIVGNITEFRRESVRAQAPLPNIGVWYTYSISPRWAFKGRLDWFGASIDDYDGELLNASFGLNFQVMKNLGIGISYNDLTLNAGISKPEWRGKIKTSYEGLFANFSFYWK